MLNLTLNNQKIEGEWDIDKLKGLLDELSEVTPESLELFRLDAMGIELGVLNDLAGGGSGIDGTTDPDDIPEIAEGVPPLTQLGDMYMLGEHILLCGDSLVTKDVDRLMGGEHAHMIWTDPPWNVAYGSAPVATLLGSKDRSILNDDMSDEEWLKWVEQMAQQLSRITIAGGHIYLIMGAASWPETDINLRKANFKASGVIAWVKDTFVLGSRDYHSRWEPIWYGWKEGAARRCPLKEDRTQDDVWEFDRPKASPHHPHSKPVALIEHALTNSSHKGDIVVDLFGGSGATMIACENTERRCRTMELDPKYADVIVQRWADYTGREPIRINSKGEKATWTEIKSLTGFAGDPELATGLLDE